MLSKIQSFIIQPKEVAGMEINLLSDNQLQWRLCVLINKKGVVAIREKQEGIGQLPEIKQYTSQAPLSLVINGKNILHKRITLENIEKSSLQDLLKAAIPTLNALEFYVQRYDFEGGVVLSLIRKEVLNAILNQLNEVGLWTISVTLGPFRFHTLLDFISVKENAGIVVSSHYLTIAHNEIANFRLVKSTEQPHTIRIGEDDLATEWVLPYAAALDQLVTKSENPAMQAEKVAHYKNEWTQFKIFRFAGWGALIFFLVALLVNFIFFSHFTQINIELSGKVNSQGRVLERIEKLQNEMKQREHFLRNAGWLKRTQNSFYADQLASSVPEEIQLVEMNLIPLDEKQSKQEKKPVFIKDILAVKGTCADPQALNAWMKTINQLAWVSEIKAQNYTYDYSKRTGTFDFQLILGKKGK